MSDTNSAREAVSFTMLSGSRQRHPRQLLGLVRALGTWASKSTFCIEADPMTLAAAESENYHVLALHFVHYIGICILDDWEGVQGQDNWSWCWWALGRMMWTGRRLRSRNFGPSNDPEVRRGWQAFTHSSYPMHNLHVMQTWAKLGVGKGLIHSYKCPMAEMGSRWYVRVDNSKSTN